MGMYCPTRGISFGKCVMYLRRPTLLPNLSHMLHPCQGLQTSKLRHPLRNGIIKFIYLKKILWGIWGEAQKDINIKESKCRLFKYRELSWESEHKVPEKLTLVLYFEALQDFLSAGWPEAELGSRWSWSTFFPSLSLFS